MKLLWSILLVSLVTLRVDARLHDKKNGQYSQDSRNKHYGTVVNNSSDYFAVLNPSQNTLTTCDASTASGSAIATLTNDKFCIFLSYTGVGNETESHIHGPAPIGSGAEVLFVFSGKPNKRNCFTFNTTHVEWLINGLLYANIHSGNFAGGCLEGEIRGQILPAIYKKSRKHRYHSN